MITEDSDPIEKLGYWVKVWIKSKKKVKSNPNFSLFPIPEAQKIENNLFLAEEEIKYCVQILENSNNILYLAARNWTEKRIEAEQCTVLMVFGQNDEAAVIMEKLIEAEEKLKKTYQKIIIKT